MLPIHNFAQHNVGSTGIRKLEGRFLFTATTLLTPEIRESVMYRNDFILSVKLADLIIFLCAECEDI